MGPKLSDHTGERAGPYDVTVTPDRIESFRAAVGAGPAGVSGRAAPPTFMTIFREGEFELFRRLGVPLRSVLHAEQIYRYGEHIEPGDQLRYETELMQVTEKRGGTSAASLTFLTLETRVKGVRAGRMIDAGSARTVVAVRGSDSGKGSP